MSRRFKRPIGTRRYKRLFLISTEGSVTEPQYFNMFNNDTTVLHVKVVHNGASDPGNVLKEMKKHLKKYDLEKNDQAWLVIDKDQWQETQISPLYTWSTTDEKYGFALSNPKFEYWLLLHFEEPSGISSSRNCSDKLNRHLPGYDKKIDDRKLRPSILTAIDRARRQNSPPCRDWPRRTGTTIYRLVEELIKEVK
jgi:hypothetical protein